MNHIEGFANHFNPFSDEFRVAVEDFRKQDIITKVQIIGLTVLAGIASFFVLGLGAIPAFRWAVIMLKSTNYGAEDGLFDTLRMKPADAKRKADCMVNSLPVHILGRDQARLLEFDLEIGRPWTRADLTNGSQLQQLYDVMTAPVWNPPGFDAHTFVLYYNIGYTSFSQNMKDYIQQANFKQLKAMSAYILYNENEWADQALEDYNDLSECCLTFVGFAKHGVLNAWLARVQELLTVQLRRSV